MARQEFNYTVQTQKFGRVKVRVMDRVTIDDVMLHLVRRELHRLSGGEDAGIEVPKNVKDFLTVHQLVTR